MKNQWADNLNDSLQEQIRAAIKLKIHIPEFIKFESQEEWHNAALNPDVFIRDNYGFRKTLGIKVGFGAFYNGERFVNYFGIIRDAFMFSGSQGLETDDNVLMIYGIDPQVCRKYFKRLERLIEEKSPGYKGFAQLNVFIDPDGLWWYDSIIIGAQPELILCFNKLVGSDDIDYSSPLFFQNRYAGSIKVFPFGWPRNPIVQISQEENMITEVWDTLIPVKSGNYFVCFNGGTTIKDMWKKLYHRCAGIERFNYLYRVDGSEVCRSRFHEIKTADLV